MRQRNSRGAAAGWALLATLAIGMVLAAVFAFFPSAEIWAGFEPGNCREYCERYTSCDLPLAARPAIQQPLNSWSNLAFVFVGFFVAFRRSHPGAWLFAISCTVLGIGSFLFHASVTLAFQWFDVAGMYFVDTALLAWGVHRTLAISYSRLLPLVVISDIALGVFKWQLNTVLTLVTLSSGIAALMAVHVRAGLRSLRYALLPGALIAVAYGIRGLDVQKVGCVPDGILQGHALWHLLSAATLFATYHFFAALRPAAMAATNTQ